MLTTSKCGPPSGQSAFSEIDLSEIAKCRAWQIIRLGPRSVAQSSVVGHDQYHDFSVRWQCLSCVLELLCTSSNFFQISLHFTVRRRHSAIIYLAGGSDSDYRHADVPVWGRLACGRLCYGSDYMHWCLSGTVLTKSDLATRAIGPCVSPAVAHRHLVTAVTVLLARPVRPVLQSS